MQLALRQPNDNKLRNSHGTKMDSKVINPFSWLSKDGKLLLAARILRTFAYGFLSVILAIYLKLIGFNDLYIGFILTATLVNSVIFTLIASFYADRIGRRKILIIYSALMSVSGIVFFVTNNYMALIISAFIGTINVTGTETGAFLSIEQAMLPQTINDPKKRNTIYALYNMAIHSLRRYVKSTISDLGYQDYSEWFIGHSGSTYYRKKDSEKAELFRKIEPYLTFLDYSELEARGADVVTKLQEKDKQIEALTKKQVQLIQSLIDSGQVRPK
jgi:hypothetical protein